MLYFFFFSASYFDYCFLWWPFGSRLFSMGIHRLSILKLTLPSDQTISSYETSHREKFRERGNLGGICWQHVAAISLLCQTFLSFNLLGCECRIFAFQLQNICRLSARHSQKKISVISHTFLISWTLLLAERPHLHFSCVDSAGPAC